MAPELIVALISSQPKNGQRVLVSSPGAGATDLVAAIQAANEGVLYDLFGGGPITHPPFDETKEVAMVCDQHVDHGLRQVSPAV